MIRELMAEMYSKGEINVFNRKQVDMIIERVFYKLDANNLPDIQHLKQNIKKEANKKFVPFY